MISLPHPAWPLALFLAAAPAAAVLQFRALAPLVVVALLAVVALGWRQRQATMPAAAWLGLALAAWGAASALWAVEPSRSLFEAARLAALILLATAAYQAFSGAPDRPLNGWLLAGAVLGAALTILDQHSGHALRALVRGLQSWTEALGYGLKPAASVLALLLPALLALPLRWPWRAAAGLLLLGAIFGMPAQAAKIGALAGLAGFGLVWLLGQRAARAIAIGSALLVLLTPALLGVLLARNPDISAMQGSAAHRVLIWDFSLDRIAERPWLGWGMESARAIPGGRDLIPAEALTRFHLDGQREWFEVVRAQRLPLHTHNAALQIWLELGAVGAALAAALVLVLGWRATSPAAAGTFLAAIAIGSLSYGVWQGWWVCLLAILTLVVRPGPPQR